MTSITANGIRGYLHWVIKDQPGLAQVLIPQIQAAFPEAFSDHDQSQVMGLLQGGLADDSLDLSLFPVGTDTSFDAAVGAVPLPTATAIANTANTGSLDPAVTAGINNIVNATIANLGVPSLTAAQYTSLTNAQLQQAQNGFPPTSVSSATTGIGQLLGKISTSLGGTTGVLLVGAVLVGAALILGGGSNVRARR